MSEIKYQKLDTLLKYLKKSKIKAGEGKEEGKYPFYTSSAKLTKRIDIADYQDESIVLGSGGLASIHYIKQPFSTSTDCFVLTPIDENIDLKYVYYYLKSNIRLLEDGFKGVGLKHISKKYLSNIKIPIQSLENQRKISAFLTRLEKLIEKRQESIKLLDELIKSTFLDMFGDPVLNNKGWNKIQIKDSFSVKTGKTPSTKVKEYWDNGDINWANTSEVNKYIITDIDNKITMLAVKEYNLTIFPKNTILLAMYGQGKTRGKVALLEVESTINQAFCAIEPNEIYNTKFLLELLKNMYSIIRSFGRGGNQENLNLDIVKKIKIIKPPKSLQDKFARIVTKIEDTKKLYQNSLDELNNLFNSTAQKAFKGELDVSKIEFEQTQQKEAVMELDKEQILELIKKGNFDPKDYITSEQSYDDIRDMIIGTKGKTGLIDDGLVLQKFDEKLKKMTLKAKE